MKPIHLGLIVLGIAILAGIGIVVLRPASTQPQDSAKKEVANTNGSAPVPTSASPAATVTDSAGTYHNAAYGFSMTFPKGWKNDGVGYVYPSITYVSPNQGATLRIWIPERTGTVVSVAAEAEAKISRVQADLPGFTVTSQSDAAIGSGKAHIIEGTWVDAKTHLTERTKIAQLRTNKGEFELTATAPAARWNDYQAQFEAAMQSFTTAP